ncbi:apolipoprotein N-acyltransferase [Noviherbaspirillum pedocola]|uniref:Apolipoprotein N-acyltransferase n=1 Tax=Noviherbaspirillum pedocola TaxID=2801341 RepID=A0A934SQ55_9BURK|nr:apolipoprotein N-acyltransferase [Noviherbaspirillum pedocola]MBK4733460.1 apolipoprotein N-acyltransferase [Noviherbaspirillum pedocola]
MLSDSKSPALSSWALSRFAPLAALLAGIAAVAGFAPLGWWPLEIASLALLSWLVSQQVSAVRSALVGWCFSFGWMAAGVYWLYISMHDYGGMPALMAAAAVALLAAWMAAYAALAMWLATRLRLRLSASTATALLLIHPPLWMLGEWLRGWIATGFPWLASGYAHTGSPLAGYAPLVGVYGIGWLAMLVAGCLALAAMRRPRALILGAVLLIAGLPLARIAWTEPQGKPISVRLLQGNVPQEMKFNPEQVPASLALYREMITEARADLIATPETAMPILAQQLPPDYLESLTSFLHDSKSHLVLGVPVSDGPNRYANSALGFGPDSGNHAWRYDKHHLVPFGEFIPPGARWFVDMMNIPLGDFTRGDKLQPPFEASGQWIMPNICYEDLFGEEIADQIAAAHFAKKPEPTMLLNMSNIAWFGDSIALPQHLQISQMRALELRRPMLRATNTGATAVIDARGQVQAELKPFTRGTLAASVQGMHGLTPYIVMGNALPVTAALLLLGGMWLAGRRKPA